MKSLSSNRFAQILLGLSRPVKRLIALAIDVILIGFTVWLSFYLRLGEWVSPLAIEWQPLSAFWASLLIAVPIFIITGLYRNIFRFSGLPVLMALLRAIGIYGFFYAILITVVGLVGVPRTIGLIQPVLLFLTVAASRVFVAFWLGGGYRAKLKRTNLPRVLIYGAGTTGRQLASALRQGHQMNVLGFLDDDSRLVGNALNGHPIFSASALEELIQRLNITDVLLALPSVNRKRRNDIISYVRSCKVHVRTLPSMTDLAKGNISVSDIRELDIEDLLGRDPVEPNAALLQKNITNKVVLVTGAGGSIGSELCRQILMEGPAKLVLFEQGEFNLYRLHQELLALNEKLNLNIPLIPVLGSVRDEGRLREVFSKENPQTIYHAAAYKHVPLVEENPVEGILNNVFGTLAVARVAAESGVESFTLISTDKAVRPTNVMGASKRLAEMVLQALAGEIVAKTNSSKTIFSMVRFGNVLDSSGSVVPRFKQQIAQGGPVTLTHPEVTRYFMTIPEAAQLVIQASAMATGGDVFLLDMGEPVKIMELARRIIELSGLTVSDGENPNGDIEIEIIGLRPGEKLYEELLISDNPLATDNERIMKAHEDYLPWPVFCEKLSSLEKYCSLNDRQKIEAVLKELVSGYIPDAKGVL
ncbi:polysaccharide biosynthesis protein [Polynucleobacter sp. 86C-FISCH]|uniref:polysaccharide biosynthesis protein n=1 Tax=Polynucleobacter sp. 86C-FISCH TaxID=2689101 RepID=UPI001C0D3A13|nr:nucleoside-diphosphate sugar epimerase/dehydratase [Polynucleobacter sp. 86C-FISCH]MBU3595993.1 polysaccharide biosynthesis protein [Polynucleobacter sp. 86C-FISCH]